MDSWLLIVSKRKDHALLHRTHRAIREIPGTLGTEGAGVEGHGPEPLLWFSQEGMG